MPLSFTLATEDQIDLIEQTAFRIMDRIGMQVEDAGLLERLRRAGARVEPASGRVRLSEAQIRDAMAATPAQVTLAATSGRDVQLGAGAQIWGSLIVDPIVVDFEEGCRPPRLSDVARHAIIGDYLPRVGAIYLMDNLYTDVPTHLARPRSIATFMSHMAKPMLCAPMTPADARVWLDMAEIAAGGRSLVDRPLLGMTVSPLSPLRIDPEVCHTARLALERGATFWALSMPLVGVSGPFPLAGTAALQLAETFFLVTLAQTLRPGGPVVSCAGSWPVNLASGAVSPGSAERLLVSALLGQVHARYPWPTYNGSFSTDVISMDVQNGAERMLQALVSLAPADFLMGLGSLGAGNGVSAEMIVMDHDLVETLDRVRAGVRIDAETVAFEAVERVGPGGDFTADDLTLKLLRSGEYYFGGSFDRPSKPGEEVGWLERAHRRVEQIVASHVPAVPPALRDDLERYVARWSVVRPSGRP